MTAIKETVFVGYDNEIRLQLRQDGAPIPFIAQGVSEIRAEVTPELVASSLGGFISFDNDGVVTLRMGRVISAAGVYIPKLIAYSPEYPQGRVMVSKNSDAMLVLLAVI